MASISVKQLIEQNLGKIPLFFINAVLELILIIILIMDGLIAFAANEFARFFEMRIPCLFCTRIDRHLVSRDPNFYYNDSICEAHRKDVSSLAYCHVHQKLSDTRRMCEGCLFSFATGNKSDCEKYRSLVGILGKDLECSIEDDNIIHLRLSPREKMDALHQVDKSNIHWCSCCGEPLRIMSSLQGLVQSLPPNVTTAFPQTPDPTPRSPLLIKTKNEETRGSDHLRQVSFKLNTELEIPVHEEGSSALTPYNQCREYVKIGTEDLNEDACKTPAFIRGNRLFGVPLTDSAAATPRWIHRLQRRLPIEKLESGAESMEGNTINDADSEAILNYLKKEAHLDRNSLIALYMELDEERNASAVAANQAMAMITRLQEEKAAVRMEAFQYQRIMDEQAEYDQKALQAMKDLLNKREMEIRALKAQLELYREKAEHGVAPDIAACKAQADDAYCHPATRSDSLVSTRSVWGSPRPINETGNYGKNEHYYAQSRLSQEEIARKFINEPLLNFEGEKFYPTDQFKTLENKINSSSSDGVHHFVPSSDIINLNEEDKGTV
ncbi:PREDICTED: probable myosin-binding protein 6 [Nelumbo nucifera]|uniref:Probable myosin-binding protein 6 n=1 Tax=Nelumbo nucifera TaxID=4432 RepID=A0A1U8AZM5_NELNU|nr:PREDICTED: probable myosin-binding protein 6 [Nelumbo nucifera]